MTAAYPAENSVETNSPIGEWNFEQFEEQVRRFHGYAAPGVLLGGFMVEEAKRNLPQGILYDAIVETSWCLPDAVQMLTPCTVGNGWMRILNFGIYSVSLFDKRTGEGVRVCLDPARLAKWPTIGEWHLKLKPKKEQDSPRLREEIRQAGATVCSVTPVRVREEILCKRSKGKIAVCPVCGAAYPEVHGKVCRSCRGESPYLPVHDLPGERPARLKVLPVELAVGRKAVHDMTGIVPGVSKGAAFQRGQIIEVGDVCRLQRMGRMNVYVEEPGQTPTDWVHEDEAAVAFSQAMAGPGVEPAGPPREGKVNLRAAQDGILLVKTARLEAFNLVPEVMAASRRDGSMVRQGQNVAGTRALPLHISRERFQQALRVLESGPLFSVAALRKARAGILVTGSEVFQGIIEDRFAPIITSKLSALGSEVVKVLFAPDDAAMIRDAALDLLNAGCDLVVTTAGLSVDPDDVTRQGLVDAGATQLIHGAPILPGANMILGRLQGAQLIGVPACALFFKTTAFDLILPKVLAGIEIKRSDLARMGHGGMCMECKTCTFPKCPFGR